LSIATHGLLLALELTIGPKTKSWSEFEEGNFLLWDYQPLKSSPRKRCCNNWSPTFRRLNKRQGLPVVKGDRKYCLAAVPNVNSTGAYWVHAPVCYGALIRPCCGNHIHTTEPGEGYRDQPGSTFDHLTAWPRWQMSSMNLTSRCSISTTRPSLILSGHNYNVVVLLPFILSTAHHPSHVYLSLRCGSSILVKLCARVA